ncbi:MAG: hypothetical protein GWP91_12485 [Rhodobacterales bacterium]|nr:hypothetical protein [Rhodobacterales bacterium]
MQNFTWTRSPWDDADPLFPVDWISDWMHGGHRHGRARATALDQVHRRLSPAGVITTALIGGHRVDSESHNDLWYATGDAPNWYAEAAGQHDEDWIRTTLSNFWANPDYKPPAQGPCLYSAGETVVLDAAGIGYRSALVLFRLQGPADLLLNALMQQRAAWWVVLMLTGLLRGERYRQKWQQITGLLVDGAQSPWRTAADQPVNPQEVTRSLAQAATAWVARVAHTFEVATVCVFLPDPDDEYVFCLAAHGSDRFAYDADLVHKPSIDGVHFGLTGSWATSGTARGAPRVRTIDTREDLHRHYRDLGYDPQQTQDNQHFQRAQQFVHPEVAAIAAKGPWLVSAQQLPDDLSPTARNLVVRLAGRSIDEVWATSAERHRTSHDRRARMGMVSARLHTDVLRLFREGLGRWRDGLRQSLLRELSAGEDLDGICQSIASWCSARGVSLWTHTEGSLTLRAWSRPQGRPVLSFDVANPVDARELRLLHAPLYPSAHQIGEDGFLGWDHWRIHTAHPAENTATLPILQGGRTVGVLRIEGALSLFAGVIPRNGDHGALNSHRPTATPRHLRPALEEVAQLLALVLTPAQVAQNQDWDRFMTRVRRHHISHSDARRHLEALHQQAPSRGQAAEQIGIHRNTFRRHLVELRTHLGDDLPW